MTDKPPLMSVETLIVLQDLQREIDVLWLTADLGTERRATLREVAKIIDHHIVSRLGREP